MTKPPASTVSAAPTAPAPPAATVSAASAGWAASAASASPVTTTPATPTRSPSRPAPVTAAPGASAAPTVFLVDDQPAVLKALARLLASAGFSVRAFGSAQAFLDSDAAAADGCLVLDLSMPDMNGLALQQALAQRACLLPLIFLTGHGDLDSGIAAMKHGAADFLTKPVDDARLIAAVARALDRNRAARADCAERDAILARLRSLTPRETEVLDLIVEGLLNKQVAAALGTVEKTVKVHRARVMTKMQVKSVTALVRLVDRARAAAPPS